MERVIKFRGKRIDNGEWVYGSYLKHQKTSLCIATKEERDNNIVSLIILDGMVDWGFETPVISIQVVPESVGEFTGLTDKNGKEIYEKSKINISCEGRIYRKWRDKDIVFHNGSFGFYHDIISSNSKVVLQTLFEPLCNLDLEILEIEVIETPNF